MKKRAVFALLAAWGIVAGFVSATIPIPTTSQTTFRTEGILIDFVDIELNLADEIFVRQAFAATLASTVNDRMEHSFPDLNYGVSSKADFSIEVSVLDRPLTEDDVSKIRHLIRESLAMVITVFGKGESGMVSVSASTEPASGATSQVLRALIFAITLSAGGSVIFLARSFLMNSSNRSTHSDD